MLRVSQIVGGVDGLNDAFEKSHASFYTITLRQNLHFYFIFIALTKAVKTVKERERNEWGVKLKQVLN